MRLLPNSRNKQETNVLSHTRLWISRRNLKRMPGLLEKKLSRSMVVPESVSSRWPSSGCIFGRLINLSRAFTSKSGTSTSQTEKSKFLLLRCLWKQSRTWCSLLRFPVVLPRLGQRGGLKCSTNFQVRTREPTSLQDEYWLDEGCREYKNQRSLHIGQHLIRHTAA